MSFFEPLPPREPQVPREWSAPVWDRPSEGTLPAILPVHEVVLHGTDTVVELEHLRVYPNGFTVNLLILGNPRADQAGLARMPMLGGPGRDPSAWFPRIGVRFSDGRAAGRDNTMPGGPPRKDDSGLPTDPVLTFTGGGGGSAGFYFSVWVYPLPPVGQLEIFVAVPSVDGHEARVVFDGAEIRAAAERATVIWH